jgi:hypothetical protein
LRERLRQGVLAGGSTRMQTFYNEAMMAPFEKSARSLKQALAEPESKDPQSNGIPVFLFGNVLPDPAAPVLSKMIFAQVQDYSIR